MKRHHRRWHRRAWVVLALLLPLVLAIALVQRNARSRLGDPVRLGPAATPGTTP